MPYLFIYVLAVMTVNDLQKFWTFVHHSQQYFHLETIAFAQFLMVTSVSHNSCSN